MFSLNKPLLSSSLVCLMFSVPTLLMAEVSHNNQGITTVGLKQTDKNIFVIVEAGQSALKSLEQNRLIAKITTPPSQASCKVSKSFESVSFRPPARKTDKTMLLVTCDKNKPLISDSTFSQSYFIELQEAAINILKCNPRLRHRSGCKQKNQQVTRILTGQL